jgi:aspartate ammonia-lyase
MPGKVNPSIAEMVNMVAYQIMGNDLAVCAACQAGQLELNVMMPVVAWNLLQSIKIATNASRVFAERCIDGIKANADICLRYAEMSSALATALSPKIGYEKAAEIAKLAVVTKRSIREIAKEKLDMPEEELDKLLDVRKLTSNKEWQET